VVEKNLVCDFSSTAKQSLVDWSGADISIAEQASLLSINRTTLYYGHRLSYTDDLEIKRHIDGIYTAHPDFGYCRICARLNRYESIRSNHKTVLRHMQQMGIQTMYPRQNTSRPNPQNHIIRIY